jgi:hypothetical protein
MKFVFLESGDSLELKVNPAKIITVWFDHLFSSGANLKYSLNDTRQELSIEDNIKQLNSLIELMNYRLKMTIPENTIFFDNCYELDQNWLNRCHKIWARLTHIYKDIINGEEHRYPLEWHQINHLIHDLENRYLSNFYNTIIPILPPEKHVLIEPEDGTYYQTDLLLHYGNLGRHQYNQWLAGTDLDDETNNYNAVSYNIEYRYFLENPPVPAPTEYISWCIERNVKILPPWIPIGNFTKYDRHEVRKLFYKNLLKSPDVGFEL